MGYTNIHLILRYSHAHYRRFNFLIYYVLCFILKTSLSFYSYKRTEVTFDIGPYGPPGVTAIVNNVDTDSSLPEMCCKEEWVFEKEQDKWLDTCCNGGIKGERCTYSEQEVCTVDLGVFWDWCNYFYIETKYYCPFACKAPESERVQGILEPWKYISDDFSNHQNKYFVGCKSPKYLCSECEWKDCSLDCKKNGVYDPMQYPAYPCSMKSDLVCQQCSDLPWPNTYLKKGKNCAPQEENYFACDECTDPQSLMGIDEKHMKCPPYSVVKGRPYETDESKAKEFPQLKNYCLPCQKCNDQRESGTNHPKYFLPYPDKDIKCVTNPHTECRFTHLNLQSQPSTGLMPFVFAKTRVWGAYSINYNDLRGKTKDTLPHYEDCSPNFMPTGYRQRNESMIPRVFYDHYENFDSKTNDCNPHYVGECADGFYARLTGFHIDCYACQPNSYSQGGLTVCQCASGWAQVSAIKTALSSSSVYINPNFDDDQCIKCTESVSFRMGSDSTIIVHERISCLETIQRCTTNEYLDDSFKCISCANGTVPSLNKASCISCEKGKFSNGNMCITCDGAKEYCPDSRMTAPIPKIQLCNEPGKMFVASSSNTADNECQACKTQCPGETYIVYENGHNESNGCSLKESNLKYFACYDPQNMPQQSEKFRTLYSYNALTHQSSVQIDLCKNHKLPEHSEWVESPQSSDIGDNQQCVFACKHGWRANIAKELQDSIHQSVYQDRIDLKYFLEAIEKGEYEEIIASGTANMMVNWPEHSSGVVLADEWQQTIQVSTEKDNKASRDHRIKNTFLYVDEVMSNFTQALCLAPSDAYDTTGCPIGFFGSVPANMQCALDARNFGVNKVYSSDGMNIEYVNAVIQKGGEITCAKKLNEKWIPLSKCNSCLDNHSKTLRLFIRNIDESDQAKANLMLTWLRRETWSGSYFFKKPTTSSPYAFNSVSSCTTTPLNTNYFSLAFESITTLKGIQAFIPCDFSYNVGEGLMLCQKLLGNRFNYDSRNVCKDGAPPCIECNAMGNVLVENYQEKGWLDSRSSWTEAAKICKYRCRTRYTSNKIEAEYPTNPCISCMQVIQNFSAGGMKGCQHGTDGAYFNKETELTKCGPEGTDGITEYTPLCSPCFTQTIGGGVSLIFSTNSLFNSNDECLAICPPGLYRTLFLNESTSQLEDTTQPIMQSLIKECKLCTDSHVIACNNSNCTEGYYLSGSACLVCNSTPCNDAGYYRTKCIVNSISDSRCALCDEKTLLYNDYDKALEAILSRFSASTEVLNRLWKALNDSQIDYSRRWIKRGLINPSNNASVFMSTEGCLVACINNYAWLDFRTGLPPIDNSRLLQPYYGCVPCNSDFIRIPANIGSKFLYSIWNYSGVLVKSAIPTTNSAFRRMSINNLTGGCYLCPPNTDTLQGVDIMCQAIPGYGQKMEIGVTVEITTVVIDSSSSGAGLTSFIVDRYSSKRMPVAKVSNNVYFTCCKKSDFECKVFMKKEIDADQSIIKGPNAFYSRCMNNATGANYTARRLLQTADDLDLQKCLVGQYNHQRGGTTCFDCPSGASTVYPYDGIDAKKNCACLPGYYGTRNHTTGNVNQCKPCGMNWHRTVYMNESACEPCPQGMVTPTETSANCYCEGGSYFSIEQNSCVQCEEGGYCESGLNRIPCPENSWSKNGSKTRSDCICNKPGFYGSLANPESICRKVPPTLRCDGTCECAVGWYPVFNTSQDGLITTMRCITECGAGQYAMINPITFEKLECKACPLNTYSSSHQSVFSGNDRQQCTPCPPNFQTITTGCVAPSQCACLSGIKNTTTSECGKCPVDTFLNTFSKECQACPQGATAPLGSVGFISCVCPKGSRSVFHQGILQCEVCPLNMYAASAGFSCTACPQGMITKNEGSTSLRQCLCPEGKLNHAGLCV